MLFRWSGMRRRWWPWWGPGQQTGRASSLTGGEEKVKIWTWQNLRNICCAGRLKGEGHLPNNKGTRWRDFYFPQIYFTVLLTMSHCWVKYLPIIYQERYFKLVGNLLFCLRINSHGKVSTINFSEAKIAKSVHDIYYMLFQGDESDPVGVLLMENFTVNPDPMQACIWKIGNMM